MYSRKAINIVLTLALLAFAAGITINSVAVSNMLRDDQRNSLLSMYDGTAEKPYVYRTLLPHLAQAITAVTPQPLRRGVENIALYLSYHKPFSLYAKRPQTSGYSSEIVKEERIYPIVVMGALMLGSLAVYALALARLSTTCFPGNRVTPWATAFLGLAILIPFVNQNTKIYDFPDLTLSALCLLCLCERRWNQYIIVFTLACINKETAIFYTGLFIILFRSMPERQFARLLLAQCVIFTAVIGAIHLVYMDNPGVLAKYYRPTAFFLEGFNDLQPTTHMLALIVLYRLVSASWKELPAALRQSFWVLAADGAVYYLFGQHGEYRVFFDAFPGLTIIAGHTLFKPWEKSMEGGLHDA